MVGPLSISACGTDGSMWIRRRRRGIGAHHSSERSRMLRE
jgi:hypothetical protein